MFKHKKGLFISLLTSFVFSSSLLEAATVPNAPGPYIGVTPIPGSQTSVRVNFLDNSNDEDGFRIFDDEGINVEVSANDEMESLHVFKVLTGLVCDKTYQIKAVAYNTAGDSETSDSRAFNLHTTFGIDCDDVPEDINDSLNAPGPHIGLTAIEGSKTSVRVSFLDNSNNEDGFRIFDGEGINVDLPANDENESPHVYKTLTGLICDHVYTIRAVAHKDGVDSDMSDARAFNLHTTFGIPCDDVPPEPKAPVADAGDDKQVEVDTVVSIVGTGTDEDGVVVSYEWREGETLLATTAMFDYMVTGTDAHTLTFTVIDDDGLVNSDEMIVTGIVESDDLLKVEIPADKDSISEVVCATIPDSTEVFQKVDIMFLVDVSGSYSDDLSIFRARANEIMAAFEEAGQDVQISLASFSDFPISPYGSSFDYAFRLDQPLTDDFSLVTTAINNLTILSGGDIPESQLEGLFQAGESSTGWREGALPIIFLATDASFHNSDDEPLYPGHGLTETVASLVSKGIKVFGLQSGGSIADVIEIADFTDGSVFNLSSNSAEIVEAIEAAIVGTSTDISVTLEVIGDDGSIVESITPNIVGAVAGDAIDNVNAGDEVCFNVVFTRGIYSADTEMRIVRFQLRIVAEGVATVKEIPVRVDLFPKEE